MFPLYMSFVRVCMCSHLTLANVMLSNDSGAHNVHYVCMNYYCNQWTPMSKFVFEFCANVGVMFELGGSN